MRALRPFEVFFVLSFPLAIFTKLNGTRATRALVVVAIANNDSASLRAKESVQDATFRVYERAPL
jgi:hypothetical protein